MRRISYVSAFDPTSLELWRTPIELPRDDAGNLLIRPYSSVIYSARQRHALVIGGGFWNTSGDNNVWRIPLGDGPSVPIGHWDFINSQLGNLDYMSSVYWRVALGRRMRRSSTLIPMGTRAIPARYSATGIGGMTIDPSDGTTWFTTWNGSTVNVKRDTGSAVETRYSETRALPIAADAPDAVVPYNNHTPFFGNGLNLKWQNVNDYLNGTWHSSFVAPFTSVWQWTHIPAIAHRNFSEAWAIVEPWYYAILPGLAMRLRRAALSPRGRSWDGCLTNTMAPTTRKIFTAFPAAPVSGRKTSCSASTAIGGSAARVACAAIRLSIRP